MEQDFFNRKQTELGIALNDMQKQAVLHTDGPLLILATPGSGKTTTIIMRIGYLIEVLKVAPEKIKAVTFSRAAVEDMVTRFKTFFPHIPPVEFSTIHSLAFSVVRDYFYKRKEAYELIEGNQGQFNKQMILRNIYEEMNGDIITADHLEELLSYISFIKNKMIPREKWHHVKCDVKQALEIIERYEQFKQGETGKLLLDYDDMLTIAYEAFDTDPVLLAFYQVKYDYVLTDESQDSSLVQHAIIEKLSSDHQNICVVADDDQSIYTWRAAEPDYLLDFKKVYPNATILLMEKNYRSQAHIVSAANEFIKQNKKRYDKNMFTANETGEQIVFRTLSDYREQASYLVVKTEEAERYADIAILYRNNLSSIVLVDAMDKAGIPFYMKDTDNRFFEHWVVEDLLNFMRLAYDDTRVSTLEKIYTKFNGYISRVRLESLKRERSKESVFDRLMKDSLLKDYQLKNLQKIKGHFTEMNGMKPTDIIAIIRNDLGYDASLDRISERFGFNITYLHEILHVLEEIAVGTDTMEAFAKRLSYLKNLLKEAPFNKSKNAVTLSTLHSSKGLEFMEVYMIDLVEGNLPATADIDALGDGDNAPMEEAVRLFYVGMTRAAMRLELVSYKRKIGTSIERSRFLTDVQQIVHPELKNPYAQNVWSYNQERVSSQAKNVARNNPLAMQSSVSLKEGLIIKHRVFGRGEITLLTETELTIQFQKEAKRLLISTCIENGLLEIVD